MNDSIAPQFVFVANIMLDLVCCELNLEFHYFLFVAT